MPQKGIKMHNLNKELKRSLQEFLAELLEYPDAFEYAVPAIETPENEDIYVTLRYEEKEKNGVNLVFSLGFAGINKSIYEGTCVLSTVRLLIERRIDSSGLVQLIESKDLDKYGLSDEALKAIRDVLGVAATWYYSRHLQMCGYNEARVFYDDGSSKSGEPGEWATASMDKIIDDVSNLLKISNEFKD